MKDRNIRLERSRNSVKCLLPPPTPSPTPTQAARQTPAPRLTHLPSLLQSNTPSAGVHFAGMLAVWLVELKFVFHLILGIILEGTVLNEVGYDQGNFLQFYWHHLIFMVCYLNGNTALTEVF